MTQRQNAKHRDRLEIIFDALECCDFFRIGGALQKDLIYHCQINTKYVKEIEHILLAKRLVYTTDLMRRRRSYMLTALGKETLEKMRPMIEGQQQVKARSKE